MLISTAQVLYKTCVQIIEDWITRSSYSFASLSFVMSF